MYKQSGVIFPLTVVVSFFFLLMLAHVLALYEVEMETMRYEQQSSEVESIMQMAVFDVKKQIASSPLQQGKEGTFLYPIGKADYEWKKIDETTIQATISAYSDTGIRYSATFLISLPSLDIIQWTENGAP
ncbi:competence type IV pilus minor pilin ComGG [Saccharococcus thermophilus]|uniref:Competence protein ComGG n=1 Tax=Saccharococcus thermophilus TaxID=29396 RepID=A0A846MEE1_9BACL|nr:competence type IV pilus minor pilin ComGG [Saccharococcus thermophilus]NIK15391.1 competence protein ComGG [Saccharococcus thermophilus]